MSALPTPLRIALWFVAAIWLVGLIALLIGALGKIVLATTVFGGANSVVEWLAHRDR